MARGRHPHAYAMAGAEAAKAVLQLPSAHPQTFAAFVADAQSRGYTHVVTMAGPLPLTDWHPYGLFGGVNSRPGCPVEAAFRLRWIAEGQATDADINGPKAPFVAGAWTFIKEGR